MSFNTSLSGLNAASADLDTTSHNIANVSSAGFKGSRAEFADVYAVNAFGTTNTAIGSGVALTDVKQQFNQGNMEFTDNNLDLAISGRGFFILSSDSTSSDHLYTRAGAFGIDENGFMTNGLGQYLQVFPVDQSGTVTSTSYTLSLQTSSDL